jgi:hypothetical protein
LPFDRGPFPFDGGKKRKGKHKPLNSKEKLHHGDVLRASKELDVLLVAFLNIQTLPEKRWGMKNFDLSNLIREYNFGHIGLVEPNQNWYLLQEEDRLRESFCGHFNRGQFTFTSAHNIHDKTSGKYQIGGTVSITTGNLIGRLDGPGGRDPTGLGRFSWHRMRERGEITLRIMTFYRPCKSGNGTASVYSQQLLHLNATGRFQCPRNALMQDVQSAIVE